MQSSIGVKQEILNLEKQYWQAMVDNDFDSMMALTDLPCIVAGPMGSHAFSKDEFKKLYETGESKVKTFEFDESSVDVRHLSPETAIIAYKITSTFEYKGEEKTIEAADTSTWVKRDGRWMCAMHTETEIQKH